MTNLLLLYHDDRTFEISDIKRIFEANRGFSDVRLDEPGGAAIEADYVEHEDRTIVGLSRSRRSISLAGTTDAAFHAALILQRDLGTPLRLVDTGYTFDFILEGSLTVEELRAAVEDARTS
jgi:hypothetical protein